MKRNQPAARTVRLAGGQTLAVPATRATRVVVDSGRAWVTVEGDARDFVLPAGRAFSCDTDGLLVVQMLDAGTLTIALAGTRPATPAQRWRGFVAQLRHALRPAPETACQS